MLELVDDALKSATEAETKRSEVADEKFSKAIESLKEYEEYYHPNNLKPVQARMKDAKANDKSSSTFLNRLKDNVFVREKLSPLLRRILISISSQSNRSRRRK